MGNEVRGSGYAAQAEGIFRQIVEIAPDNPAAVAGLAQALLALGRMDEAEAALAGLPEDKAGDPAIAKAKAGIALAKDAATVDDFAAMLAEVAAKIGRTSCRERVGQEV